jgi:hypothetical protein
MLQVSRKDAKKCAETQRRRILNCRFLILAAAIGVKGEGGILGKKAEDEEGFLISRPAFSF